MLSGLTEPLSTLLGPRGHLAEVLESEVSAPCFAFTKEPAFYSIWSFGLPVCSESLILFLNFSCTSAGLLSLRQC